MSNRVSVRPILAVVFFLSGGVGLVYEVLWTRQLSLIFGVTTYAVATVLSAFMLGLAAGSYTIGRWVDRRPNPLMLYAALEAGIGLYALAVTPLFAALRVPFVLLHRLDLPYQAIALGRAILAALVLIVPTTLMGGTFPALARFWISSRESIGRGTGHLYFINTTGAIVGCLLAGFYVIEHFGLAGTTWIAVGLNLAIAATAAALASLPAGRRPRATEDSARHDAPEPRSATATVVLWAIGLSGFTSLGYEVLWTRALLRYVYNSTYAFTTMLATFLAGIAFGSFLYTVAHRHVRRRVTLLAVLQALVAIAFAVSAVLFTNLDALLSMTWGPDFVGSFRDSITKMFLEAALILLPPTLFLGATFPLATEICARDVTTAGHSIGRVYAVNTFGAILGSLVAAFVLIPWLGMIGALKALMIANFVAAASVAAVSSATRPQRVVAAAAVMATAAIAVTVIPADMFKRTFVRPGQSLVFYEEGATDTVGVSEYYGQRAIQYDDLRGTAGTGSFRYNFFLGHFPLLLHPGEPRRVLHICFGVGNSLSAVAMHDEVERVDNVELSPHVVEAAPYFWTNGDVIHNPKLRTIIDDGRNYLMATSETYDVILMEPPETFTAGVINLYTTEFYRDALAHLAPDGIMMQWIPTGEGSIDEERRLFRAFTDVFPHATAWRQMDSACILLIGTKQPLTIDYQRLAAKLARPAVRRDMDLIGIRDVDHLLSLFVFDEAAMAEFTRDVRPVTDDRTVLDFTIPRRLGSGFGRGTWGDKARADGRNPWTESAERGKFYADHRRSVLPLLRNLGGDTPEDVAARIAERSGIQFEHAMVAEADWRR